MKNLKSRANAEELGVTNGEIRETRTKDLLFEVRCAAKDRGSLDSIFRCVVGETGSVRHLVPTVEVEILGIDPTVEAKEPRRSELPKRGDSIGGKSVRDEEDLQRHQESLHQVGGGAGPETAKNDPH